MVSILTGDIVQSRSVDPNIWHPLLEESLTAYSTKFDIFRGDSFQAEIPLEDTFKAVFYIKSAMLKVQLDVRIGVGVGQKEIDARHIKNAFGSALTYSGEAFEALKKETIHVKSGNEKLDEMCNVMLTLVTELCSRWTPNMAETVLAMLLHEQMNQVDLAKLLHRKHQSQVSTALQKASFTQVKRAIDYCTQALLRL